MTPIAANGAPRQQEKAFTASGTTTTASGYSEPTEDIAASLAAETDIKHWRHRVVSAPGKLNELACQSEASDEDESPNNRRRSSSLPPPAIDVGSLVRELRIQRYQRVPHLAAPSSNKAHLNRARVESFDEVDEKGELTPTTKYHLDRAVVQEVEKLESRMTVVFAICIVSAMASTFQLGYHTSVMSAAAATELPGHSPIAWTFAVTALVVGGFLGASMGGTLADKFGRTGAVMASAWLFFIGGLVLMFAQSMETLIIARLITGLGSGIGMVVVPIYIGEIAPPKLRGPLGTGTQLSQCAGILVADVLEITPFSSGAFHLFAFPTSIAAVQLLVGYLLPLVEGPPYLVSKSREGKEKAVEACVRLYGLGQIDANDQVEVVEKALMRNNGEGTSGRSGTTERKSRTFADGASRTLLMCVLVLHLTQQLSGINAVFFYAIELFDGVVSRPDLAAMMVAFVNLVAVGITAVLIDSTRRRALLAISYGGMISSTIVVTAGLLQVLPRIVAVVGVMAFVFFFELAAGPLPFLIIPEMYDSTEVAPVQTLASQVNWICNIVVGLGFMSMKDALGAYTFAPFAIILLTSFLFLMLKLPETLDRTPDQIRSAILDAAELNDDYMPLAAEP